MGVIFLGRPQDQLDHIGETAAAAAALRHGMIDLDGNNELPTVLVKELNDRVPDFPVGDVIATANQHSRSDPRNMTFVIFFFAKEDSGCQEKIRVSASFLKKACHCASDFEAVEWQIAASFNESFVLSA